MKTKRKYLYFMRDRFVSSWVKVSEKKMKLDRSGAIPTTKHLFSFHHQHIASSLNLAIGQQVRIPIDKLLNIMEEV